MTPLAYAALLVILCAATAASFRGIVRNLAIGGALAFLIILLALAGMLPSIPHI
jgi:hypothetical protein